MPHKFCPCSLAEECVYSGPDKCEQEMSISIGERQMSAITAQIRREDALEKLRQAQVATQREAVNHV